LSTFTFTQAGRQLSARGSNRETQQPHAIEQSPLRADEMWSENQERDTLPITTGTGQAPLPDARRAPGTGARHGASETETIVTGAARWQQSPSGAS